MLATLARSVTNAASSAATSAVAYAYGDNFVDNAKRELAAARVCEPLEAGWVAVENTQPAPVQIENFNDLFAAATVKAATEAPAAGVAEAPAAACDEFTAEELARADGNISGYFADGKWVQLETPLEYCRRMRYNDSLAAKC